MSFSSHHIREYTWWIWLIMSDINLDHLARVIFASLLLCKVTSPPCHGLVLWKHIEMGIGGVGERRLSFIYLRLEYLYTLSSFVRNILRKICLFSYNYFLNHLFLSVWTHGYLCYTLGYNPMSCYWFRCWNYCSFVH